jgi:hypothetical protein
MGSIVLESLAGSFWWFHRNLSGGSYPVSFLWAATGVPMLARLPPEPILERFQVQPRAPGSLHPLAGGTAPAARMS